ncbi:hypothetical protein PILCRDRAFT_332947 [Piloderma croceum F 1598]|uniref:WW domain-containing protein n=1 Tax=Piloderma croceum (strain F 1598) TaxID=765440 RepID=A0A0C3FPF7_PILCF|nr:hypothetical protein PILCRDRAFT_332947 [Piloderma croceum F 1598]
MPKLIKNHKTKKTDSKLERDTRPLPPGWSQHYDKHQNIWFYLNNDAVPVTISYVHPSDARPVLMDHLLDRQSPNEARVATRTNSNQQSAVSVNRSMGSRTTQPIYGSSPKPSVSPAPSGPTPVANTRLPRSDDGQRSSHNPYSRLDRQSSSSINLGAPAPIPPVTTAQNGYPPQLLTYLATGANLSKYSSWDGQTAVPHHTASVSYPVAPSRPSSSRSPNSNAQELTVAKPTSQEPMSAPPGQTQHVSNGAPRRTQSSYLPSTAPSPPAAVLSNSSTSSVGGPRYLVPSMTATPVPVVRPLAIRQRPVTQPAPVSPPSASSRPSSSPNAQWVSDKPKPHRRVSGSGSSTPSLYPSHLTGFVPPQAASTSASPGLTSSPASHSLPPTTNQSSSIAFSYPASHQRSMTQPAHVSTLSAPLSSLPAPNVRRASDRPEPQRHVSASESSTTSSYPSPPKIFSSPSPYVNPVSPPTSYPFPPTTNQSSSTTFSSPTLASHQRSATQLAHVSPPSAIPPPSSTPNVQWISNRPEPHRHVSASESSTSSSYPSPPTKFSSPQMTSTSPSMGSISPPDSHSFPPIANQSSSTTLSSSRIKSLPSTPALTHSTPSQPPTPLYDPMPPTPQAPLSPRTPVASQPAPKGGGFGRKAMLTMAGGAAVGILKGTLKNAMGGGNGLDMNGIVDSVGNVMDGGGDAGGGDLLDGVFNAGDGTNEGSGGRDSGFQLTPWNQDNNPSLNSFFDPSSQGNSDGSDSTSISNQASQLYNQYQQQQQSGPDYVHIAHEAYNLHAQQQHQQAGHHVGPPAGVGQASSGAQHSAPPHAQTVQHGQSHQHSQTYPHGQASQSGQTTQPPQAYNSAQAVQPGPPPGQNQGFKINANHVKQAAKGAILAGRVLAKFNGVNIGNNG